MARNIIGIDISDASIEAIILDKKKGHFVVQAYSRYRLSPDIVEDGKILQADKLKEAIKGLLANAQPAPIQSKKVFLSIPESKVFTRVISLPKNIRGRDLDEAAQHKAEELIPESFDNLVSATKFLPDAGDNKQILFAAAELAIVNDFLKVFSDLGMDVLGIVPEALSSFAGLDEKLEKTTTLMLDLGARTTIATVFDGNGIRDSINVNIAGDNLVSAIAAKMGLPYAQAEEKMKQSGMTADGDGEVMLIVQGQLQPLVDEIKRFVNYYQEVNEQKIEQLVLLGGLAQMKGIDAYFGDNLGLATFIGSPFIAHENLPDFVDSTTFINVLGLAKMSEQKPEVNFLNDELQKKSRVKKPEEKKVDEVETSDIQAEPKTKKTPKISFNGFGTKLKEVWFNKYFIILLVVIILFSLFIVFKDKILPSTPATPPLNTNQAPVNVKSEPIPTPAPARPKSISYDFVIGINPNGGEDNFILAEYYNLVINKQAQDEALSYEELSALLLEQTKNEVFSGLNIKYTRDEYLVLPIVVSSDILSTTPTAEEFKIGDDLNIKVNYSLLAVPKGKVLEILRPELVKNNISSFDEIKLFDSIYFTPKGQDANLQVYYVGINFNLDGV